MSEGHFEAVKYAYRQSKEGFVLSFIVHPSDMPDDMATAPIGSMFVIGYAAAKKVPEPNLAGGSSDLTHSGSGVVSSSSRDDRPLAKPIRTPSQRAAYLCTKSRFWSFLNSIRKGGLYINSEAKADAALKAHLGLTSKTELDKSDLAAEGFEEFESEFKAWAYGS